MCIYLWSRKVSKYAKYSQYENASKGHSKGGGWYIIESLNKKQVIDIEQLKKALCKTDLLQLKSKNLTFSTWCWIEHWKNNDELMIT